MVSYTPLWVTQLLFLSLWVALGLSLGPWPFAPGSRPLSGHLTYFGISHTPGAVLSVSSIVPPRLLCTFLCLPHPFYKAHGSLHLPWALSIHHGTQQLGTPVSVLPFFLWHFGSLRTSQVPDLTLEFPIPGLESLPSVFLVLDAASSHSDLNPRRYNGLSCHSQLSM